jgi:hypothetical protein
MQQCTDQLHQLSHIWAKLTPWASFSPKRDDPAVCRLREHLVANAGTPSHGRQSHSHAPLYIIFIRDESYTINRAVEA